MSSELPPPLTRSRVRTPVATLLSLAWLSLAAWWSFFRPCGAWEIPILSLNEWGDWAAGAFAPLAFLWLTIGYFQQGEELRENARALHLQEQALRLQVKELKESVEQQAALANATAIQADLLEKSQRIALRAQLLPHQPRFAHFGFHATTHPHQMGISLENIGAPCTSVCAALSNESGAIESEIKVENWAKGDQRNMPFSTEKLVLPLTLTLQITYDDDLQIPQEQIWQVDVKGKGKQIVAVVATRQRMTFSLPAATP